MMSERPRIFVSHSHEDDAFCQRLITDLRALLGEEAFQNWHHVRGNMRKWRRSVAA